MRFDKFKNRLASLEVRRGLQDAKLTFADGSTRSITVRDPLGCLLDTWRRVHARLAGRPMSESRHDKTIALFGRAVRVDADDHFLQLLHEEAQKLAAPEPEVS